MTRTLGQRISGLRAEYGLSLEEVAKAAGISEQLLQDIEHDRVECSLEIAVKLALLFDVSVNMLVTGLNDPV